MEAVIVAGGKGTRLRSISGDIPKPMVDVAGEPILRHLISCCAAHGFKSVHLLTGYRADVIRDYFGDGHQFNVHIEHHVETTPLGTAGAVKAIESVVGERFLLMYGDVFTDMNLSRLVAFDSEHGGMGTLVVHSNNHPIDSDLVEIDPHCRITAFHSKPHVEGRYYSNLVNAGVAILSRHVLHHVAPEQHLDFGRDIYPRAVANGEDLYGYNTPEYIHDMGTPDRLARVRTDFDSGLSRRMNLENRRRAVFIDRDGTLNRYCPYIDKLDDFELIPEAIPALKLLNGTDWLVIVVTNQPQVARGQITEADVRLMHKKMETLLGKEGAKVDAIYYCPHHPDSGFPGERPEYKIRCECRKPAPGMYLAAAKYFNIDLSQSVYVGDSTADIAVCHRFGGKSVLLLSGAGGKDGKYSVVPTHVCNTVLDAVRWILAGGVA